jgi:hypothetical protein
MIQVQLGEIIVTTLSFRGQLQESVLPFLFRLLGHSALGALSLFLTWCVGSFAHAI